MGAVSLQPRSEHRAALNAPDARDGRVARRGEVGSTGGR